MYYHNEKVHRIKVSICRFCGESFLERSDLDNHLKSLHTNIACSLCKLDFETQTEFVVHAKNLHNDLIIKKIRNNGK